MTRPTPDPDDPAETPGRPALSPEAERALAEARARRSAGEANAGVGPRETGGRDGPEPVRYGDWELRGRAIDF